MAKRSNGEILFEMVEQSQNYAYLPEAIADEPDEDIVMEKAQSSLYWHLDAAQKLLRFISSRVWNPKAAKGRLAHGKRRLD